MQFCLLDANAISDLVRNPSGAVAVKAAKVRQQAEAALVTSIVVAAELRYGALKKNSKVLSDRVNQLLEAIPALPLGLGADHASGRLRYELERAGTPIGPNDMLIAAHSIALDATLVTDNVREFMRVPHLRIENWLRD